MVKSPERILLEKEIQRWYNESLDTAIKMVGEEFGGNLVIALSDSSFIDRVQIKVSEYRQKYIEGYERLEELEKEEGFPATQRYAEILDLIKDNLPQKNRDCCYYPFSGIDLYWARIFRRIIFEDIGFNRIAPVQNMWWDLASYQEEKRKEVISILEKEEIISGSSKLEFLSGDSQTEREDNSFNNSATTLLVKGGHDVLGFLEYRFRERRVMFGAIITVTSHNPVEDMDEYLRNHNYERTFSHPGEDFLAPYSTLEFKDIYIFLKG